MQNSGQYNNYKELALMALQKYKVSDKVHCKHLMCAVKKSFSHIKNMHDIASESASSNTVTHSFVWLTDNFYMIQERKNICIESLKNQTVLAGTLVKSGEFAGLSLPIYFAAFYDFLSLCDKQVDVSVIDAFISACEKNPDFSPEYADLYSFELLFCCACICKIGSLCKQLTENPYTSEDTVISQAIGKCVNSIRLISSYNFEGAFENCETEEYLRLDPAGFYSDMTDLTKNYYRKRISELSAKHKMTERDFAKEILEKARSATDEKQKHIGAYLYPEKSGAGKMYFILLVISVCIFTVILCTFIPAGILLVFPIFEAVKQIYDRIFAHFVNTNPLPALDLKRIPDTDGVLVVITTLLFGEQSDDEIFSRLENIYVSNGMKNIYFAILGDFPDSALPTEEKDKETLSNAECRISSLNAKYRDSFFLFVRNRKYAKTEDRYMGYERKRGAVCSLTDFLCGKGTNDFIKNSCSMPETLCESIRYVITLDSDTNLAPDSVRELAGIMLHPLNRPTINPKSNIVESGYAIMQPRIAPELHSACKTRFSRIMCGTGGVEVYSFAQFDLYQSVFSEGVFCGKGIFDKYAFSRTINNPDTAFLPGTVLSHDILEGARLRTALVNNIEVTDSFPPNAISYLKRHHRWVRGDVQNLSFLGSTFVNENGKRVKNNFSLLSKFKIADNVRREIVPVISFFSVLAASFLSPEDAGMTVLFSIFWLIFPFISDLCNMVTTLSFQCAARRFFSRGATSGLWQSFIRMLFGISMLPTNAFVTLDAVFRALWRMNFSHKHTLEWVTAAQSNSQSNSDLLLYIQKNLPGTILGTFLFIFSPYGAIKLIGLMWFLFPLTAYFTSLETNNDKKAPSTSQKKKIKEYALDMWHYFENTVTEKDSFFPPDNLQLYPAEILAHRTSPTNIGLYLLSVLCAKDFGFINTEEMYARLSNTLASVEKATKWKGHLYNWYNTEDLSVLNPVYISSVDSGNFLACIITLKEGLKEYVNEKPELLDIIYRIEKIIKDTDIEALYNKHRNLFSLGISIENGKEQMNTGCYDLFMSEARTLSFIAVATRKVPKKHWQSLSRPLIKHSDRIGVASWTGTAFEYFMPALFLPTVKGSLMYEALMFALVRQKNRCAQAQSQNIWGISESGYFGFDSNMNYKYKAFGIPELGYKTGLEKDLVISPYSSFLAMCLSISSPLENLKRLKNLGACGKLGFYEAYDFTKDRTGKRGALVKSHMSHHVGMSVISCANAYFGDIAVKRFMSDVHMRSAKELLQEKIPVDAPVNKLKHINENPEKSKTVFKNKNRRVDFKSCENPYCRIISDGSKGVLVSDAGLVKMYSGENIINRTSSEFNDVKNGFFVFFEHEGKAHSTSFFPLCKENAKYSMEYSFATCSHICKTDRFKSKTTYLLPSLDGTYAVRFKLSGRKQFSLSDSVNTAFCFEPILASEKQYYSHPAFSSLFVTSEYSKEHRILIYKRKNRTNPEKAEYLAVGLSDRALPFDFSVRKNDAFGTSFNQNSYENIFKITPDNKDGACITPLCFVKTSVKKSSDYSCTLFMATGNTKEEALSKISRLRNESLSGSSEKSENMAVLLALNSGVFPDSENEKAMTEIVTSAIYPKKTVSIKPGYAVTKNNLWETGISGDIPIFSVIIPSETAVCVAEKYIRAYILLSKLNFPIDLALCYTENEKYRRPVEHSVISAIEKVGAGEYLRRKKGGIFPVSLESFSGDQPSSAKTLALFSHSCEVVGYPKNQKTQPDKKPDLSDKYTIIRHCNNMSDSVCDTGALLKSGNGCFDADYSYTINKTVKENIRVPQSMVLSGRTLSSVLTHSSLGYTFAGNAALKRITPFHNYPCEDMYGERIFLKRGNTLYDLAAMSQTVKYGKGYALYSGKADTISYSIKVYIPENISVKVFDVNVSEDDAELLLAIKPIMGENTSDMHKCSIFVSDNIVKFTNPFSEYFAGFTGFIKSNPENAKYKCNSSGTLSGYVTCSVKSNGFARFALGAYASEKTLEFILSQLAKDDTSLFKSAESFVDKLLPDIKISSKETGAEMKSTEIMFNFWLPYQNSICRFFARSGFYQSGGAYGFRDQLQDSLMLMYANPKIARAHIIRCCMHQFEEGDVLHWWHPKNPKAYDHNSKLLHAGIRSLCSDDYIWLVYAVCEYVKFTGDTSILDIPVRYAHAQPLKEGEKEKYILCEKSEIKESVLLHCIRTLDLAYTRIGNKGLCLLGTCDWSDGLNKAGENMKGESVWLSMFLKLVTEEFSKLCANCEKDNHYNYSIPLTKLTQSINKYTFDKTSGYFIRAWYDDGTAIGSTSSDECKIDLLPQAFSVLSDCADNDKQLSAITKAHEILYDNDIKIFKLLSPAFDNTSKNPGYIKGYVPGIRENGGQYTHAAIWGAMALIEMGVKTKNADLIKKGTSALMWINPALRGCDKKLYQIYKCEPYVLCADIYSNKDVAGHGGWSWYTGSAGWMWRGILKNLFGITLYNISDSKKAEIQISENAFFAPFTIGNKHEISIDFKSHNSSYKILYSPGNKTQILVDGKEISDKIKITSGNHIISITGNSSL